MKKILFAIVTLLAVRTFAQSTAPRFGTNPNKDNTGRTLVYKLQSKVDAAGADTITITSEKAFHTIVKVELLDSLTLGSPVVTNAALGDQMVLLVSGTSGDKLKFTGTNWLSSATATLSSGAAAVIEFIFNGTKWQEKTRTVQ